MTLILAVVAALVIFLLWGRHEEIKAWNGGRCCTCDSPFVLFDYDSQGGRGYKCSREGFSHGSVWISYNIERGLKEE